MDLKEKVLRLKQMLRQVKPLEEIAPPDEGVEGARPSGARFAPSEVAKAASGLRKLQEGREDQIDPEEARGLEAIILPNERPVYFVSGGNYPVLGFPWTTLNDTGVRTRLRQAISAIGRIELPTNPRYPYGGTGFLVGKGLLMTNRHVAELFVDGLGVRRLVFNRGDAAVDFVREKDTPDDDRGAWFEVLDVVMVHPFWDMALLRIDGLPATYAPLTLSVNEPAGGTDVVAIGYPARDDRNDLATQDRIFERIYNVKRFQPGKARPRARTRSFGNLVNALTHDSSTLGGNSGSAVVDPATGHVVGLHFAGQYLKANYMVPALELARDARVVDAGVNFAGALPSTDEWEDAWRRVAAERAAGALVQSPSSSPGAASGEGATASWTIPLKITVSIGAATGAMDLKGAAPAAPTVASVEAMRVPIVYDGLETREGFNPDFLEIEGAPVNPPVLSEAGERVAAPLDDGTTVLKYHKFSVVMHKARRMAIFTAANVDWRPESRKVNGKKPTRKQLTGLGDNDIEKWVTDWRIAEEHQLPDVFYTKDRAAFDKGHLVRRDDVAWGTSFEDMQMSNGDTYHTTNCSPQIKAFNQAPQGEDNWGDLEDMVQKETNAEKAIVFSGPVLARDDRFFEGRDDSGPVKVRIPRRFWKIVVVKGDEGPEAFGFVLEQDLTNVPFREELVVPEAWVAHMKPIADIEELLYGLASLEAMKEWDQFGAAGGESIRSRM